MASNVTRTTGDAAGYRRSRIVLVVVAHSDDESLGMGGTIARHVADGDKVYALSMTDGVGARGSGASDHAIRRAAAAREAARALGFEWLASGDFPDNAMDSVSLLAIVQHIEKAKAQVGPQLVYTHSAADLNVDHRILCEATLTAFRPQPGETWEEIRCFEVPSATDYGAAGVTGSFVPNLYVDIVDFWESKLEALRNYADELRPSPHSRSLEGLGNLARYRGNQAGLDMAEAFQIVRKISRR